MSEFQSSYQNLFMIFGAATFIIALVAFVLAIMNALRTKKMRDTLDVLFAGKKAHDLEEIILHNNQKLKSFDSEIQELFNISNKINTQTHKGLNKVGLIRFDPFQDYSGNQSFALALLNSADDGVVVSSIHTREGTRIYAKEIQKGHSKKHELTQEERDAITQAN